jgi:antitoxin MazE
LTAALHVDTLYQRCLRESAVAEIVESSVNTWGNGLALRITRGLAKAAGVAEGTPARITAEPGRLVVETLARQLTMDERLRAFDPARHGGEAMAFQPAGQEVL